MILRALRFFIGGIFFVIGVSIMEEKDVADIFVKTLKRKDELISLSEKHGVYR